MTTLPPAAAEPSQQPNPGLPQGAQIPLQRFALPEFPPQAQGLKALTLTADLKLTEYTEQLKTFTPVPPLPTSIESLTLELFSLGYPAGFLAQLSSRLPNVKSLVVYSQLLAGTTKETQQDAVTFFANLKSLRALHLLDVFSQPHFFEHIAPDLRERERGLMFLEINYTFRHSDEDFLTRVPASELPFLISPSLITCALNISPPEVTDDPNDPTNLTSQGEEAKGKKEGIMAFNKTLAPGLVDALTADATKPRTLRVLNVTLYTLSLKQLQQTLQEHKGLLVLSATIEIEPTAECKTALLEALAVCPDIEQVEIVGNPSLQFFEAVSDSKGQPLDKAFPSAADLKRLSEKCPKLVSFKATVLRTASMGRVEWNKEGGTWTGGVMKAGDAEENK